MKIAHLVTGSTFAGIEQHVYELAQSMQDEMPQIILCELSLQNFMKGVKTHPIKMGSRYSLINIYKLHAFIKKNSIDILHCHGAKASIIGGWISLVSKIKIVATIHGHKANNNPFKRADIVIGVNKQLIKNLHGAKCIPNWFNPSHQGVSSSRTGPIIAIGRLEKVKGFNLLIQSWVNIKESLQIIGSGPEEKALKLIIDSLGLSDRIEIITNCSYSSIEEKYKVASGLIISSFREGGPRVLLEALNHEIPVIGTKVGILPQLISEEFLAEPHNLASLQALLEEIIPIIAQLDVTAIKESMHENYSISKARKATIDAYSEALNACS